MKKIKLAVAVSALTLSLNAAATTTVDLTAITHPAINLAGTDFNSAIQDSYVSVDALEVLDFANMLMCVAGASGIPLIPNDSYLALADLAICGEGDETGASNFTQMIVESTRASNDSPQESKVWIEYDVGGGAPLQEIHFKATITAAPTDLNPVGEWTIQWEFQGLTPMETGYLSATASSGAPSIEMVVLANDPDGSGTQTRQSVFQMTSLEEGQGTVRIDTTAGYESASASTVITNIAITPAYVRTQVDANAAVCLDVDDFVDTVYSYNLYDETGALVDITSNLEFTTPSGSFGILGRYMDGTTARYWIWIENELENAPSTTTVTKGSTTYTLTWDSNGNVTNVVDGSTGSTIAFDDSLQFDRTVALNIVPRTLRSDSGTPIDDTAGNVAQFYGDYLNYDGPGRLNGLKWTNGAPAVGFADGTKLTDTNGDVYYVKAIEISKAPVVAGSQCDSMTMSALPLPATSLATSPSGMTTAPTVSLEPRVINGELTE